MVDSPRARKPTATSNFGVGKREGHDATGFYERFQAPVISDDDVLSEHKAHDEIWCGDARDMDRHGDIADGSVALVVTSPPYFAGKAYEEALGENGIPADYLEYLQMLRDVFAECVRKLEPGGRIAVNVANLGRKPYRSLSSDVVTILQDELGLLMRGEIIWQKGKGAGGSCAWGSFQRPGNPVLRDVTERVIVASKGRFDRARSAKQRAKEGRPSVATIPVDEFLESTLDIWELAPESAKRVGHPAPFPVALPRRLIHLYTYAGDLVLDPFMGAGTTAVAAVETGRHFVGFDMDEAYCEIARGRARGTAVTATVEIAATAGRTPLSYDTAAVEGRKASDLAAMLVAGAGLEPAEPKLRDLGIDIDLVATDTSGQDWYFQVAGSFTESRPGLRRTDILLTELGKAAVLRAGRPDAGIVILTTEPPVPRSAGAKALDVAAGPSGPIDAVIELLDPEGPSRLAALVAPD